jgi:type IV pilus assembly protein PilO
MAVDYKQVFEKVLKLPVAHKVLLVAGLNAFIAYGIYAALISPKYAEAVKIKGEISNISQQLEVNRKIAADIPRYIKEKEELEVALKKAIAQLPNEKEIHELLEKISEAGHTAGLKIKLFRPGRETPSGLYAEVPVDMKVEGTYRSIIEFCSNVSKFQRIVNLGSMKIKSESVLLSSEPILAADFIATTFMFLSDGTSPEGVK